MRTNVPRPLLRPEADASNSEQLPGLFVPTSHEPQLVLISRECRTRFFEVELKGNPPFPVKIIKNFLFCKLLKWSLSFTDSLVPFSLLISLYKSTHFQPCRPACDSRNNMISNALTGLTRHHYQPFRGRSLFGDSWIGCELFSSRHLSHLTWVHKQLCGFPVISWLGMSPWDRGSFMAREWL